VARVGFTAAADAYERGRPSYPDAAVRLLVDELGIGPGRDVLDLAAGTGKLTRLLVPTGARVTAVEPVEAMRALLTGAEVLDGTAEAIPLPDASVDVVTVGQAFHWFDPVLALAEIDRVLRPGGRLGLIWNERDESVPWVSAFTEVINDHGGGRPYVRDQDWAQLTRDAGFVDVATHRFDNPVVTDRAGVVERAASTSYVAALPDDRRAVCLAAIAELVAGLEEPFVYPHTTDLTLATNP
jgi:SAM-dependent methyltransferase